MNSITTPTLFTYYAPTGQDFIGLISIPHSGEYIPEDFKDFVTTNKKAISRDVDTHVDKLIDINLLQKNGIGVMVAHIHRVCVDLNRSEEKSVLFWKENTYGEKCSSKELTKEEEYQFICKYHKPYFELLKSLLEDLQKRSPKGKANFVDLHSMPSKPTAYHMKQKPNQKIERADFCLSDLIGKTCDPQFIKTFESHLSSSGYSCAINDPYYGGYITEFANLYKTQNIQIEINRKIYMNEDSRELTSELSNKLKPALTNALLISFKNLF